MTSQPPPGSRRAARQAAEAREQGPARSSRPRKQRTTKQRRWRTARRVVLSLVALGIIGPIVAFMVAYVVVDVPDPASIKNNQVATIFYDDGKTPLSTIVPPEGNRTDVTIDEIPVSVRYAVLAAEDRTFYTNPGFSVAGIARAALNNVTGGDTQGGSTITQQYVKNALTGDDQTITRKLKELVISSKMSRQTSKDDILTAYLNTIYFGRGAYGIAAASTTYFGKDVSTLSVPEAAVLASSIRSPSAYDPENHPEAAQQRWAFVLDGMVGEGWVSSTDRDRLTYPKVQPRSAAGSGSGTSTDGPEGLVVSQVQDELAAEGISEQDLAKEGLQITTTISKKNQDAAVSAVQGTLADQPENLRPAVVSVDPTTGGVKAYYGNSQGSGTDFAGTWAIQPGSSFKVFSLATALKQGVPLSKTFDGSSPQTIAGQQVSNSDGEDCGRCDLAQALKLSLNTVYYQLTADVGAQNVVDTAHAAGIPATYSTGGKQVKSLLETDGSATDGVALGQYGVPPLYMASAYGTLAANGVQHDPYFIQKVTTADGRVLLDRGTPKGTQAIDTDVAQNVISAMEPIAASSRDHELADGRQSAAKTGTAQLADTGQNANGWMIGCTPSLCTASVVTTNDNSPAVTNEGRLVYGSGLPSDIWKSTMDGALAGTPGQTFPDAPELNGQPGGVPDPTTQFVPRPTTEQPRTTTAPPTTTTRERTTTTAPPTTTTAPPTTTTTAAPPPTGICIGACATTTTAPPGPVAPAAPVAPGGPGG